MTFAKTGSLVCPLYLSRVRAFGCYFAGSGPCSSTLVHAHHVKHRSSGVTDDSTCIGVCAIHHKRCHGEVVTLDGIRGEPIPLDTQWRAVSDTRSRFLDEATAMEKWTFFKAVMAREEARGEGVIW